MTEEESKVKCDAIRQIACELHVYLGTGYLEKVYENGLAHRLSKQVSMSRHKYQSKYAMKTAMFLEITLLICL